MPILPPNWHALVFPPTELGVFGHFGRFSLLSRIVNLPPLAIEDFSHYRGSPRLVGALRTPKMAKKANSATPLARSERGGRSA